MISRKIFTSFQIKLFPILKYSFSWSNIPSAPQDSVISVMDAFQKDIDQNKINLGVGVYRNDEGKVSVLECVRRAETLLLEKKLDNEYLPTHGFEPFIESSLRLAYEEHFLPLKEKRIAAIQTLSGTGALKIGLDLVKKYLPENTNIMISNPSWPVHQGICLEIGLNTIQYRYYNPITKGLDFEGMIEDFKSAPEGSVVIIQTAGHNPTGVDIQKEQWIILKDLFLQKKFVAFFDLSYQGFATGDIHDDAYALRLFAAENDLPIILAHSFAKNFTLYGERIGCLSTICSSEKEAGEVQSQMKIIARRLYSSPPLQGARIISTILHTKDLYELWLKEIKGMAERTVQMRKMLVSDLQGAGSQIDWSHLTKQIGMFAYTGLTSEQCKELAYQYHIYLTGEGRICVPGLNSRNVTYVANAIHHITKSI